MNFSHLQVCIQHSARLLALGLLFINSDSRAHSYILPPADEGLIGSVRSAPLLPDETMVDAAVRLGIGQQATQRANPDVDRWSTSARHLTLPTRHILPGVTRTGLVLNLPEMRLYHFWTNKRRNTHWVSTYAVSIGRQDWQTPLGATWIVERRKDPAWTPPRSIKEEARAAGILLPDVVPAGPDNPLGQYALRLAIPGYLLHGTNRPQGIGMRVTHGCVRLYPDDIEQLYHRTSVGAVVHIINEPVKVGWHAGALYLEVHTPLEEFSQTENELVAMAAEKILQETQGLNVKFRTQHIRETVRQRTGLPVRLSES